MFAGVPGYIATDAGYFVAGAIYIAAAGGNKKHPLQRKIQPLPALNPIERNIHPMFRQLRPRFFFLRRMFVLRYPLLFIRRVAVEKVITCATESPPRSTTDTGYR